MNDLYSPDPHDTGQDERRAAALAVCTRYPHPDEARPILQALGLAPYIGHVATDLSRTRISRPITRQARS